MFLVPTIYSFPVHSPRKAKREGAKRLPVSSFRLIVIFILSLLVIGVLLVFRLLVLILVLVLVIHKKITPLSCLLLTLGGVIIL